MEKDNSEIEIVCGNKPDGVEIIDVGNNPDYVFKNDIDFDSINLYDIEGNVISVNSWFECFHYVNGGWFNNVNNLSNFESYFLYFLISLSVGLTVTFKVYKNKK
tara:strand:+ start:337 stop:648 length:312 start_codon:yes stop_codon:yes gene_type:complete